MSIEGKADLPLCHELFVLINVMLDTISEGRKNWILLLNLRSKFLTFLLNVHLLP